jgi:hypothetical protein
MLDIGRMNARLLQRDFHRSPSAVAVFRPRCDIMGVGRSAVSNELRERFGPTCRRTFELFYHKDASAFPHDDAAAGCVEGSRCKLEGVIAVGRQGSRGREGTETNAPTLRRFRLLHAYAGYRTALRHSGSSRGAQQQS